MTAATALKDGETGGEAFTAGCGRPPPGREVIDLICELGPGDVDPDYQGTGNPSGEIDRQYLDSTKIREQIGWEAQVELGEGLQRTLDWYGAHPEVRPASLPG